MNFEETEEQNMIRNMVRSFAEEVLQPTTQSGIRISRLLLRSGPVSVKLASKELQLRKIMEGVRSMILLKQ